MQSRAFEVNNARATSKTGAGIRRVPLRPSASIPMKSCWKKSCTSALFPSTYGHSSKLAELYSEGGCARRACGTSLQYPRVHQFVLLSLSTAADARPTPLSYNPFHQPCFSGARFKSISPEQANFSLKPISIGTREYFLLNPHFS